MPGTVLRLLSRPDDYWRALVTAGGKGNEMLGNLRLLRSVRVEPVLLISPQAALTLRIKRPSAQEGPCAQMP